MPHVCTGGSRVRIQQPEYALPIQNVSNSLCQSSLERHFTTLPATGMLTAASRRHTWNAKGDVAEDCVYAGHTHLQASLPELLNEGGMLHSLSALTSNVVDA